MPTGMPRCKTTSPANQRTHLTPSPEHGQGDELCVAIEPEVGHVARNQTAGGDGPDQSPKASAMEAIRRFRALPFWAAGFFASSS